MRLNKGFSLIELIIALTIFGILIAIVVPSYKAYVIRSNRTDAESTLMQAAQAMERNFTANDTYLTNSSGTTITTANLDSGAYAQSPVAPATAIYTLTIDPTTTASYYLIKATPSQTGYNKNNGYLSIDSRGTKSWDKNNNGSIDSGENTWNP